MTDLLTDAFDDLTAALVDQPLSTEKLYGLVRSGQVVVDGSDVENGERWVSAVQFHTEDCDHGTTMPVCDTDDAVTDATQGTAVDPHRPAVVQAVVQCSTFGNLSDDDLQRARRKLLAIQSYRLEHEFWTGTLATANSYTGNQYLAAASPDLIEDGNPLGTLVALAELEQYLATHANERGMIHAQPRTVIYWLNNGAVTRAPNGLITTALGTIVVPGSGYPGTGPSGAQNATVSATNADKTWAYATGMVQVRLGEIRADDASISGRATNRRLAIADRFVSANFSPCARGAAYINHNVAERTTTGS